MGDFDKQFSSMTELLASNLEELKAENARLVDQVKRLERMNRSLEELDEISTQRDRSYSDQIRRLQSQIDILKEVIKEVIDR